MKTEVFPVRPSLLRALGPLMATAVVVGTVIGSGVFKKPQVVAASVPNFGVAAVVWVSVGLLALLGGLALAEVAVLYPRAGGNYVFLREGYGRLAGFLWGWVEFWIIRSASLAALATIFTESLNDILRNASLQQAAGLSLGSDPLGFWQQKWITVAVILGLAIVNVLGVRWGGLLQLFITTIKVGSLVAIAALPFVALALSWPVGQRVPPEFVGLWSVSPDTVFPAHLPWPALGTIARSSPPAFSMGGFATALLAVLWAYHGWMNIAPVAEEVRSPQRNIPLALLAGIGIVIALYLGANLAYALVIPQYEMIGLKNTTVATEFCLRVLGPLGGAAASAAVMCSVFGALNGNLLVGPRLLYAMGEDRLAPRALADVHPRFRTPAWAILVMAAWSAILVLAGAVLLSCPLPVIEWSGWTINVNLSPDKPLFDVLTDFAMFGAVIFETLAVTTIFVFRRRYPDADRPYRCWGYPVVPLLYLIIPAMILTNMFFNQRTEALIGVGFIAVGALVYWLWGRTTVEGTGTRKES
jgi:amino acid transporter